MSDEGMTCLLCGGPAEEEHHVAGRQIEPGVTAVICKDCHQDQHRDMEDAGVQLDKDRAAGALGRVVSFLRSLAALFASLSEALFRWADEVSDAIEGLCDECRGRFGWAS